MAQIHKMEVEVGLKCHADKYYGLLKNNLNQTSQIYPEMCKSVDIVEGDGKSVGTVRQWKYVLPGSGSVMTAKDKIVAVDERSRSLTLRLIEGELLNVVVKIVVNAKGNGSSVKWTLEYEKARSDESVPSLKAYLDLAADLSKKFDAFLLNA